MSAATTNVYASTSQPARTRMGWLVLAALAVAQLFAFWMLCSHQVRRAEARNTEVLVQQMALADCLQYIPGSTIASCARINNAGMPAQRNANSTMAGAMPVSFNR